jgi:hypothetical protein
VELFLRKVQLHLTLGNRGKYLEAALPLLTEALEVGEATADQLRQAAEVRADDGDRGEGGGGTGLTMGDDWGYCAAGQIGRSSATADGRTASQPWPATIVTACKAAHHCFDPPGTPVPTYSPTPTLGRW